MRQQRNQILTRDSLISSFSGYGLLDFCKRGSNGGFVCVQYCVLCAAYIFIVKQQKLTPNKAQREEGSEREASVR